jgi:glutamate 5-kinase
MLDLLRQEIATAADLVVVKVGTRVLTGPDGRLNESRIAALAEELNGLAEAGRRMVLVSSGAVGAGLGQLNLPRRPTDLSQLQAVAAIGQCHLVQTYDRYFRGHGRHAAQVLLTAEDIEHRARYLNVRNTILRILDFQAIPIINENDTVAVAELQTTFGDNDRLAAMVTNLIQAPLLVLLSGVEGLYDRDPQAPGAVSIPTVTRIDDDIRALVVDRLTGLSKGGMASKIRAAEIVTTSGASAVIASGREPGNLARILNGEPIGTLFVAQGAHVRSRKRWIGYAAKPKGYLVLDDGACRAVVEQGRSLLAIGLVEIQGSFAKGDCVGLKKTSGEEVARGLCNYNSQELGKIRGLKTDAIAAALGHCPYTEVVHRDNLAILVQS